LPRGLGDDPLSRQRKNGKSRSATSDAISSGLVIASRTASSMQSVNRDKPVFESCTPRSSPSYNDVFFQRRPEDDPTQTPFMDDVIPSTGVAETVVRETKATEVNRVSVNTTSSDSEAQGGSDSAHAGIPSTLEENLPLSEDAAKVHLSDTSKRGLFKRIFGRLGHQKSH